VGRQIISTANFFYSIVERPASRTITVNINTFFIVLLFVFYHLNTMTTLFTIPTSLFR